MRDPKKPVSPSLFTVNALSKKTGLDRRTLDKRLDGVEPDRVDGSKKLYSLTAVEAVLAKDGDASPLREQKLKEEIRKLRIANDAKEGKYELKANTVARIQRIGHDVTSYLAAVAREKPAALAMTPEDIPRARIELQKVLDEILKKFQGFAEHWGVKV